MDIELARMLWAQIWQVSLLILTVAVLSRWLGRNHPHFAHMLWVVVFVKAVTPPIWSSPSGIFSWLQPARVSEEALTPSQPKEPPPTAPPLGVSPSIASELLQEDWQPLSGPEILAMDEDPVPAALLLEAETMASTDFAFVEPIPSNQPPAWPLWSLVAIGVWLTGMLGSMLLSLGRWIGCWREIHRAGVVHDPVAQELMKELSARLRVRRRVRLIISQSRIGPAVLGILRPTVLIPARIIAGKSPSDLEPILAHELIHVRRGDLWVGWLQVLVQAVWWFHPLMWWAGPLLKHEAERCCDEEVIAELGLRPARYARALLDVLELKHVLKPVPVLPGVKPVEITSKRLERIMQLGQGCRKRTPWWCWIIMLLTAALTLPGAAFVAQGKDKEVQKETESSKLITRQYKVGNLLEQIKAEHGLEDDTKARSVLAMQLRAAVDEVWREENVLFNAKEAGTPSLSIKGNRLTVRHSAEVQKEIAKHIEILKAHGFKEVLIEAKLLTAKRDVLEKAAVEWKHISPGMPMRFSVISEAESKKLVDIVQNHPRTNLLQCPKVRVFSGRTATVQHNVTQYPVVIPEGKDGRRIELISDGLTLKLRPVLEKKQIRLASEITLKEFQRSNGVTRFPDKRGEMTRPPEFHVPDVFTARFNTEFKVPDGGNVLVGGMEPEKETGDSDLELFILIRVSRVDPKEDRVSETKSDQRLFGAGVGSDAGVTESIVIDEKNFDLKKLEPPTDEEVLKTLDEQSKVNNKGPLEAKVERKNVRIVKERMPNVIGPPRHYPMIGPARLIEAKFKCTVYYDKIVSSSSPVPFKHTDQVSEVVYIDYSQLVRADDEWKPQPAPEKREGSALRDAAVVPSAYQRHAFGDPKTEAGKIEPPTDGEVIQKLATDLKSVVWLLNRKDLSIQKEKVSETSLSPRFYPYVGEASKVTAKFKCTVKVEDVANMTMNLPYNLRAVDKNPVVVFIEKTAFVPVPGEAPPPRVHHGVTESDAKKNAVLPSPYLIQDPQYWPAGPEFILPQAGSAPSLQEMVEEFNELFKQKRYAEADTLAKKAQESFPENELCELMRSKAQTAMGFGESATESSKTIDASADRTWTKNRLPKSAEQRIQERLEKKTTLHFKDALLSDVAKHIATDAGINIVVDNVGLAEDGVKADHSITLNVEDVKLSSALTLILKPLNLGYMVQDQVLKITSKSRAEGPLLVVTYPVADLVMPVPQKVKLDLREQSKEPKAWKLAAVPPARDEFEGLIRPNPEANALDFDSLVKLITATIKPDSWAENGGNGLIRHYETNLSLVVRQTHKVHEQLRELLEQLRRLQDLQVALTVQTIEVPDLKTKGLARLVTGKPVTLTPEEVTALKTSLDQNKSAKISQALKITLFNGQTLNLVLPAENKNGVGLDLSPVVTPDRRFVRMGLILNSLAAESQQSSKQLLLKDGHSLLIDVSETGGKTVLDGRRLSLVTPRILVREEEEELLEIKGK